MKLPGNYKQSKDKGEHVRFYENPSGSHHGTELVVQPIMFRKKRWVVIRLVNGSPWEPAISKMYKTKKQALKAAHKMMRDEYAYKEAKK